MSGTRAPAARFRRLTVGLSISSASLYRSSGRWRWARSPQLAPQRPFNWHLSGPSALLFRLSTLAARKPIPTLAPGSFGGPGAGGRSREGREGARGLSSRRGSPGRRAEARRRLLGGSSVRELLLLVVVRRRSSLRSWRLRLDVLQDLVDHGGIGQEREDPHSLSALAQQRVRLVDPPDQLRPLPAEPLPFR